jgi:hypothetical protein
MLLTSNHSGRISSLSATVPDGNELLIEGWGEMARARKATRTCELRCFEDMYLQCNWVAFKLEANDAALSCIAGVDAGLLVELSERCSLDCFPCLNFAPKSLRREDVYINNDENKKAEI